MQEPCFSGQMLIYACNLCIQRTAHLHIGCTTLKENTCSDWYISETKCYVEQTPCKIPCIQVPLIYCFGKLFIYEPRDEVREIGYTKSSSPIIFFMFSNILFYRLSYPVVSVVRCLVVSSGELSISLGLCSSHECCLDLYSSCSICHFITGVSSP